MSINHYKIHWLNSRLNYYLIRIQLRWLIFCTCFVVLGFDDDVQRSRFKKRQITIVFHEKGFHNIIESSVKIRCDKVVHW